MVRGDFLFWDGEGITPDKDKPQNYVLFGNHIDPPIIGKRLHTLELLRFIVSAAEYNETHYHVAFAFDYDVNMILADLNPRELAALAKDNRVRWANFYIEHIPHKWLQVTDLKLKKTVRIQDVFSFFQCSFIAAVEKYIGVNDKDYLETKRGKELRNDFTYDDIELIESYWKAEGRLGCRLVESLRDTLYSAGFFVKDWHGPGALANYLYKSRNVAEHKTDEPKEVYAAARYAYAGGRFELFELGRHKDVYSYDINSAYPAAIEQLPSLTEGTWEYKEKPTNIVPFGVYHFRLANWESMLPGPTFFRSKNGSITFPWNGDVWLWSPEAVNLIELPNMELVEAWEYHGATSRPFTFVRDLYETRRDLKRRKQGAEKAYKLGLNSLYGKMAQRSGWERKGTAPTWHALSWAGWVTSYTRATLYKLMRSIPPGKLIGVETDGIYSTATPAQLGIKNSGELGEWEINHYDEVLYIQSGIYAQNVDGKWSSKYRGLDRGSIDHNSMVETLKNFTAVSSNPIVGPTTRFIGYKAALHTDISTHRQWLTTDRQISLGHNGKRYHVVSNCKACSLGLNAYDMPHSLTINPTAEREIYSQPHDIPWLGDEPPEWRLFQELGLSRLDIT